MPYWKCKQSTEFIPYSCDWATVRLEYWFQNNLSSIWWYCKLQLITYTFRNLFDWFNSVLCCLLNSLRSLFIEGRVAKPVRQDSRHNEKQTWIDTSCQWIDAYAIATGILTKHKRKTLKHFRHFISFIT